MVLKKLDQTEFDTRVKAVHINLQQILIFYDDFLIAAYNKSTEVLTLDAGFFKRKDREDITTTIKVALNLRIVRSHLTDGFSVFFWNQKKSERLRV